MLRAIVKNVYQIITGYGHMGSCLGTVLGAKPSHKRDPYVHCQESRERPNVDSSSYERKSKLLVSPLIAL